MKKVFLILAMLFILTIPVMALSIEKGADFGLTNIYEILEFSCYFIFAYLMILAKIFENRNIMQNQTIK